MRIGIVLPATPAYSETFFINKIIGLKESGFDVILFVGRKNSSFKLCKVVKAPPVHRFLPLMIFSAVFHFFLLSIFFPKRVKKFIELEKKTRSNIREILENLYINSHILRYRLDWLHFGFATMAIRSENVAKAIGAKMAISLRGYDIMIYPLKHTNCYNLTWKVVDKVHSISDGLIRSAQNHNLPKHISTVKIFPAINVQIFNCNQNFYKPLRSRSRIKILTVARLHWVKGLIYILEALHLLKSHNISFEYILIGDGPEFENLLFSAYQLEIQDKVIFMGRQNQEVIKQKMLESDIYIQYSISEGFCNAVLEAQAMGMLCIVSDAEGLPENVLHGKTGWVVPKRNPELLARQILKVINSDDETLINIRNNAIQRVLKEFNLDKQRKEFVEFYSNW